ncbi:hypothetical protein CANINC_003838 [Pichia inconspicua]|uniref:Protein arginine methyltransferase NDUFAF7 n=1 Tax=Pichia inconspicua TaxID=52247 RepID=A0A4T0WXQ4_9ASCO|nr:hypothetical protein CANINC_003838 [[Candida] inconspicua]
MMFLNRLESFRLVDRSLKVLHIQRSVAHKSIMKRNNKNSVDFKAETLSAKGKGILKMKKDTSKTMEQYIHDYSVFPETLQYRLPTEDELGQPPKPHSNIIKLVFEQGGVESMDLNLNAEKFARYPTTNVIKLNKRSTRPLSVKMLTSDFIDDCLYNVNYGYFAKEAIIFQPDRPFEYNKLQGQDEFMQQWLQAYDKYDQEKLKSLQVLKRSSNSKSKKSTADEKSTTKGDNEIDTERIVKPSLQLWHTPTELFQPYYGEGLARYILQQYKLNEFPYRDLIIYEAGAGNGTLMLNILDFIKKTEPDVYARTKYRIIEISSKLFNKQSSRLQRHKNKVEIINKSVLDWDTPVNEPCFFIALEVFDNLSHDVVRFDIDTKRPYQGYVVIDEHNDFHEYYSPDLEPYTKEFLELREQSKFPMNKLPKHPTNQFYPYMKLKTILNPLRNNLSDPEYIPTRLFKLFKILNRYFPNHQIVASDFNNFDKTIKGYNAPTVQTMYKDNMVNTDSYMVEQGYFDIMFPTNFTTINELYQQVTGKKSHVASHAQFLKEWADYKRTETKSGENPMLDLYSNADFIYS